jgi:hypothetical protein
MFFRTRTEHIRCVGSKEHAWRTPRPRGHEEPLQKLSSHTFLLDVCLLYHAATFTGQEAATLLLYR